MNGLAIVIGLAQLEQFKIAAPDGAMRWMEGDILYATIGMIALTMLVIWLPRVTKPFRHRLPPSARDGGRHRFRHRGPQGR